jgi:DtxR family transcriptional regulator, Mn-dependent transcriptional regulator
MTKPEETSRAVENFLKAVYTLQHGDERVSTNALTEALNITAPSVTDMAKRLTGDELVDYERYKGVRLTDAGRSIALRTIRRHRLIELYLLQELHYELHEVHDEAEELEHVVSDRFVEAVAERLGNPTFDPHGDPIPTAEGTIARRDLQPLAILPLSTPARVARLISTDNDMLQHTLDKGFKLEATVEVRARDPFEGPLTVRLPDGKTIVLGHSVAQKILVEVIE